MLSPAFFSVASVWPLVGAGGGGGGGETDLDEQLSSTLWRALQLLPPLLGVDRRVFAFKLVHGDAHHASWSAPVLAKRWSPLRR